MKIFVWAGKKQNSTEARTWKVKKKVLLIWWLIQAFSGALFQGSIWKGACLKCLHIVRLSVGGGAGGGGTERKTEAVKSVRRWGRERRERKELQRGCVRGRQSISALLYTVEASADKVGAWKQVIKEAKTDLSHLITAERRKRKWRKKKAEPSSEKRRKVGKVTSQECRYKKTRASTKKEKSRLKKKTAKWKIINKSWYIDTQRDATILVLTLLGSEDMSDLLAGG